MTLAERLQALADRFDKEIPDDNHIRYEAIYGAVEDLRTLGAEVEGKVLVKPEVNLNQFGYGYSANIQSCIGDSRATVEESVEELQARVNRRGG